MGWLTNRNLKSKDFQKRIDAVEKISTFKNRKALVPLREALLEDYGFPDRFSEELRNLIIKTLDGIDKKWRLSEVIEQYIDRLSWKSIKSLPAATRASIINVLGLIKNKSTMPFLLEALTDTNVYVRKYVVTSLGLMGDPSAIPHLIISYVKEGDSWYPMDSPLEAIDKKWASTELARSTVPMLLTVFDEQTWKKWIEMYQQESAYFRKTFPNIMGTYEEDMAEVWIIKKRCANILSEIKDPSSLPLLEKALSDEQVPVRDAVAKALGKIGNKQSIEPLKKALHMDHFDYLTDRTSSRRWVREANVKASITKALGQIGGPEVLDALIALAEKPNILEDLVTWNAIKGLGKIGDPRALPLLEQILKARDFPQKEYAITAIGNIGGHDAKRLLNYAKDNIDKDDDLGSLADLIHETYNKTVK